jgi:hypothetical protein
MKNLEGANVGVRQRQRRTPCYTYFPLKKDLIDGLHGIDPVIKSTAAPI